MELDIKKIEAELKRRGWTKYTLAAKMGCRRQWPYYVLSPKASGITLKTINKLAKALNLDPKELLT